MQLGTVGIELKALLRKLLIPGTGKMAKPREFAETEVRARYTIC
jgi:hypothetical protein